MFRLWLSAAALIALTACGADRSATADKSSVVPKPWTKAVPNPAPPQPSPTELAKRPSKSAEFTRLRGWSDDRHADALPALRRSCARLRRLPPGTPVGPGGMAGLARDWRAPCNAIAALPRGDHRGVRMTVERWFVPRLVTSRDGPEGRFTGYYETEITGARHPGGRHSAPAYALPPDLVPARKGRHPSGRRVAGRIVRYETRAEIETGGTNWRRRSGARVLLWLDPVDLYFLQVQGSGRVTLTDGQKMRIGYAGDNGHDYVSVGRIMIERGIFSREKVTAQSLRSWLRANPVRGGALMRENPRYVFFRVNPDKSGNGPIGAEGVSLTAGRSLAVDKRFVPYGVPLWLDTTWPGGKRPLRRLMVAQDTGNAIRGAVRGDVYWGTGDKALAIAGRMNQIGRYYMLLPRTFSGS